MANKDITIDVGFNFDDKELNKAIKSIKDVAAAVDVLFTRTASGLRNALSAPRAGQALGISNILSVTESDFDKLERATWNNISGFNVEKLARYYKKAGKANPLPMFQQLWKYAKGLKRYDNLYANISNLQNLTAEDKIEPDKGLGEYGVLQRYANRWLGHLYYGNALFPSIVSRSALEWGEYYRDINRKSGSMNRSALRYVQDRKYSASSLSRAGDYMLLAGDGSLQLLSDIYGLGLGTDASSAPGRISQKARDALDMWSSAGLRAQAHKEALLAGGLSKGEYEYHLSGYKQDMHDFIALQKKLFPEEKAIAENLKKLNKSDLVTFGRGPGDKTTAGSGVWTALAGKVAKDIFRNAGGMLESYWGESVTRNAYASREAFLGRVKTGGKIIGSVIGGLLGALTGNPMAMGAGYAAGGEIGGLFGSYGETKFKADVRSSNDMMARIRNQALWGSGYNTYFAKAITDVGIANGESAMGGLADRSMSMRARMMLGQVGEQEMLYMSMMPNYYAALMAGVTGPELMRIYKNDLDAIGDSSMKYLVGQAIGNTEALATAQNPYFNSFYNSVAGTSAGYERSLSGLTAGFYRGRETGALETMVRDVEEIFSSGRRGNRLIYQGGYTNRTYQEYQDVMAWLKGNNVQFVNNIVLPDGEVIKSDVKTADEVYMNTLQSYSVGG